MSVLIWVQTVCKGYQQKTKLSLSKERVHLRVYITARLVHDKMVILWDSKFAKIEA